jgi:hypothetical protein
MISGYAGEPCCFFPAAQTAKSPRSARRGVLLETSRPPSKKLGRARAGAPAHLVEEFRPERCEAVLARLT